MFEAIFSRFIATGIHEGGDQINPRYIIRPGRLNSFYDALTIDRRGAIKPTTSGTGSEDNNITIPC